MSRLARIVVAAMVAAIAAGPFVGLVPACLPGAAPSVAAASTGLTLTANARYVVDPLKRRVHVAVQLTATNHLTDTKTHRYFFDKAFLAVQPGTANFKLTTSGAAPHVGIQAKHSTYNLLRLDFGKQLAAGASRAFVLTFDIPDPGGSATRTTRIGTSLVSFGAWGFGGDGAAGGSVSVVFPPGFTIDATAAGIGAPTTDASGNTVYATGPLADPLTFFAYFVADRPSALHETAMTVKLDGRAVPVSLQAWPDDPAWAKRVKGLLIRGLPALRKDIGLPWTLDGPFVVTEAVSRNASGFAGRWTPLAGQIEVAYYAGTFVILHEAAHAWFDGRLLAERWASEGFASWYAVRAAAAIGEKKATGDALTPALEKVRIPLNAWALPGATVPTPSDPGTGDPGASPAPGASPEPGASDPGSTASPDASAPASSDPSPSASSSSDPGGTATPGGTTPAAAGPGAAGPGVAGPAVVDPNIDEAEYAAALKLAGLIAKRAGPEALSGVWQSIHDDVAAYQPAGDRVDVERMGAAPDWRGLLDQLEDTTGKRFDDLWAAWVVRPSEMSLLSDRAAARARYDAIVARAGAWRLPEVVRNAMRTWQFDQANALLDGAERALGDRDAVASTAAAAGLEAPDTMRTAFEGERGFAAASAESGAELAAIDAYRAAVASRIANPDPLETIGLWNAEPAAALGNAAASFAAGDLRATAEGSALAKAIWTTSRDIGRNRVIAVAASLAALLIGSWLLFRSYRDWRARRRRRPMAYRRG